MDTNSRQIIPHRGSALHVSVYGGASGRLGANTGWGVPRVKGADGPTLIILMYPDRR